MTLVKLVQARQQETSVQDALELKHLFCLKSYQLCFSLGLVSIPGLQYTRDTQIFTVSPEHRASAFTQGCRWLTSSERGGAGAAQSHSVLKSLLKDDSRGCTCLPVELYCKIKQFLQDRLKELNILSPSQTNSSLNQRSMCPQGRCQFSLYCVGKDLQPLRAVDPGAWQNPFYPSRPQHFCISTYCRYTGRFKVWGTESLG